MINLLHELQFLQVQYNAKMRNFGRILSLEAVKQGQLPHENFHLLGYEVHDNVVVAQMQSTQGEQYRISINIEHYESSKILIPKDT